MRGAQRANAILRAFVWLGVFAWWAALKKPDGSSFLAVRSGLAGMLGFLLVGAGLALVLWSLSSLARGIGATLAAPTKLLMLGPYRYVRNPLYLGAAAVFAGLDLLYATWRLAEIVVLILLGAFVHLLVVRVEEPATRRRLGAEYDAYFQRVPRWIPRVM